jgi:hypothetical protein
LIVAAGAPSTVAPTINAALAAKAPTAGKDDRRHDDFRPDGTGETGDLSSTIDYGQSAVGFWERSQKHLTAGLQCWEVADARTEGRRRRVPGSTA